MQHAIAPWRVTYTPGNWLVLSGPTSVVVMLPAPARMSPLINRLWTDMISAGSLDALVEILGAYGLDAMPDLAAFFWDADGLHGIARGAIRVVDTEAGEVAFDGAGVKTWREVPLGEQRQLRLDMEPVDQDAVVQLPLVVGSVTASAIYLNTSVEARLRFPEQELPSVLPVGAVAQATGAELEVAPEPELYHDAEIVGSADEFVEAEPVEDEPREHAAVLPPPSAPELEASDDAVGQPAAESAEEPEVRTGPGEQAPPVEAAPQQSVPDQPEVAAEPAAQALAAQPPMVEQAVPAGLSVPVPPPSAPSAPTVDPDAFGTGELDFDTGELHAAAERAAAEQRASAHSAAEPLAAQPISPVQPISAAQPPAEPAPPVPEPQHAVSGDRSEPIVVPGRFTEEPEAEDEGTIFSTNIAATHKQSDPEPEADPQVLAVWCPHRHPNAPGSTHCRICQAPVDSSSPRLTRRPVLAGVNTNYGEFANVDAGVLVGRAPDASKAPSGSYLMRVNSPSSDISRSHLLVSTQGWNVMVADMHSTNGTTVMPPGEQPFVLANGASVQVELGTILDLGDGVSLRIEPPRG